jgi:hypothetical protein
MLRWGCKGFLRGDHEGMAVLVDQFFVLFKGETGEVRKVHFWQDGNVQ